MWNGRAFLSVFMGMARVCPTFMEGKMSSRKLNVKRGYQFDIFKGTCENLQRRGEARQVARALTLVGGDGRARRVNELELVMPIAQL